MSSSSNNTTASSVPTGHTPSFIQRIGSAYSAALRELWSPGATRPDPSEVDPGPQHPVHRPPSHIEVETVYSANASAMVDRFGFVHGDALAINDVSPAGAPVSLFPNHERPTGVRTSFAQPEHVMPPSGHDAFSSAFPRDPGFSPIVPPTTVTRHYARLDSPDDPLTSQENPALPAAYQLTTAAAQSITPASPANHVNLASVDRWQPPRAALSPASSVPTAAASPTDGAPSSSHAFDPAATTTAAGTAVNAFGPARLTQDANAATVPPAVPPPAHLAAIFPESLAPSPHVPPSRMPTPWSRAAQQSAGNSTAVHSGPTGAAPFHPGNPFGSSGGLAPPAARFSLPAGPAPVQAYSNPHQPYHHSLVAPTSVPAFVAPGPSPIFTPIHYGPGFTAHGSPAHAPTIVSSGLDLVAVPNSRPDGAIVRQPRVSKHARGKDAVDVEKLVGIATQAPPSEYLMRYFTAANIHDPTTYSPKVAEYYTNQSLAVDMLVDRCNDYDMMASLEMYQSFDLNTADYGGPTINLLTHSHLVTLPQVLEWQHFCKMYLSSTDQLSDKMVSMVMLKFLHHSVRQDVSFDLTDLPEHHRGGAVTVKIAMDKLASDSFEIRQCIQLGLTSFNIVGYPQQDVTLASQHVSTLSKIALQYNDLPPRVGQYILRGMAKSCHDGFNALCDSLLLREEVDYAPPPPGQNMQRTDFSTLKFYLTKLNKFYRDRIQAGAWPAALSNSTSLLASTPAPRPTSIKTTEPSDEEIRAIAAALMSKLPSTATSPRKSSSNPTNYQPSKKYPCNNCGAFDHWYKDCPQPKQPRSGNSSPHNSRPGSRSNSRPGSRSNSRPRSRGNSRDSIRNRSSNNSNGKTVTFDASVNNASLDFAGCTAADLLNRINGLSKE